MIPGFLLLTRYYRGRAKETMKMPNYGPFGTGSYPYMQGYQQGGMQPNFYQGMQQPNPGTINPFMNMPGVNNQQVPAQPMQQQNPKNYDHVNGIEGALAYPNKSTQPILLIDSDNPLLYVKQANELGQNSILYYHTQQIDEATARALINAKNAQVGLGQAKTQEPIKYATLEQMSALEAKINDLTKQLESINKKEAKETKKEA